MDTPGGIWVVPALVALMVASFAARVVGDRLARRWRRTHPPKRRPLPR
jgi:hypothetical protein